MLGFDLADRLQHARHAKRRELAGQHGLVPRGRHKALGREVVDLVRLRCEQRSDQGSLIKQISLDEFQAVEMGDPLIGDGARSAGHPDHAVALDRAAIPPGTTRPGLSRR